MVNIIDIESGKKLDADSKPMKSSNGKVALYAAAAVMAGVAVVAIILLVLKKKKVEQQDPTPLNNVDQKNYKN